MKVLSLLILLSTSSLVSATDSVKAHQMPKSLNLSCLIDSVYDNNLLVVALLAVVVQSLVLDMVEQVVDH